jgi:hypothetical protein
MGIAVLLTLAISGATKAASPFHLQMLSGPQLEPRLELAQSVAPKAGAQGSADAASGRDDDRKACAHAGGPHGDQAVAATSGAEAVPHSGRYDGTWTIITASANCRRSTWSFPLRVTGSVVKSGKNAGQVSTAGAVSWVSPALLDGAPIEWTGTFSGNLGSGTFGRRDGRCRGTFTATRG